MIGIDEPKNEEIKENIFVILFQLHNITNEKIKKYMFILVLHDFS